MTSITHSLQYCNIAQCKLCRLQQLDTNSNLYSNLAYIKKYSLDGPGSCKTIFCIYMIYCKAHKCQMKHIGFTTTKLNKRMSDIVLLL